MLLAVAVVFDKVIFAKPVIVALLDTQTWPVPVMVNTLPPGKKVFWLKK